MTEAIALNDRRLEAYVKRVSNIMPMPPEKRREEAIKLRREIPHIYGNGQDPLPYLQAIRPAFSLFSPR